MHLPRHLSKRLAMALACAALSAPRALAWDPDAHVSIYQAAVALSPAFEKQLPPSNRDALERGVKEGDPADARCLKHRTNPKQVALTRAAEYYAKVKDAPPGTTSRSHALLVGQLIHYLTDVATPRLVIKQEEDPSSEHPRHRRPAPHAGRNPWTPRERAEEALQPVLSVGRCPGVSPRGEPPAGRVRDVS
jgi:hypothetical protein